MTSRRTYTETRRYSARVMRWRLAVYAPRDRETGDIDRPREELTNGCRLLLLRLSDDMHADGTVSVPRSVLARDLGVAPARVTEWIAQAMRFDLLDRVVRGRPGVTAVYCSKNPGTEVRQGVPSQRYARADQAGVRRGVPQNAAERYATAVPHEGGTAGVSSAAPWPDRTNGSDRRAEESA